MDDDNKKSGGKGPRTGGPGRGAPARGAKAGGEKRFAPKRLSDDKPRGPRQDRKPGGAPKRSYNDGPKLDRESRDGERKPFREKREFKPRTEAAEGERNFRKGPRPERGGDGERKPFREKREFSGEKREFKPRPRREGEAGEERPRREFRPRPEGADGERNFRKGPRPERSGDGERKPFREKREFSGEKREFRPRDGSEKPRSFGTKRHASAGDDAPRRSYGMKSHGGGERRDGDRPRSRPVEGAAAEFEGERIAKRLARAGIASRREAEDLVTSGRIKVNGRIQDSPAFNVQMNDKIELDGTEIPAIERTRLFLFHKPAGVVTTNRDPEGRKTVFDVLPEGLPRLMTVGRLDINTEGLLLLTNDGGLSRVLELPTTGWLRRYRVRVHGEVDEKALADLRDGIAVDGTFYGAIEASLERRQGTNAWLSIGLREGKNREVKNVLGALGLEVTRLIRVSFGPFQLGELPEGEVQELKGRMLRDQLGERLIEESGANFEAPITKPFTNDPEKRVSRDERPAAPKREARSLTVGEGGLIKKRQRRESARDDALGKLSTRPREGFAKRGDKPGFGEKKPFGDRKPFGEKKAFGDRPGRKDDKERKPIDPPGQRKANVWMAPGARPQRNERSERNDEKPRPRSGDTPRPRGPRKPDR